MTTTQLLFLLLLGAAAYLMICAGLAKHALELKRGPRCPSCGRALRDCSCR